MDCEQFFNIQYAIDELNMYIILEGLAEEKRFQLCSCVDEIVACFFAVLCLVEGFSRIPDLYPLFWSVLPNLLQVLNYLNSYLFLKIIGVT